MNDNDPAEIFDDATPLVSIEFDAFYEMYHQRYLDYARAQLSLSEPEQIQDLVEDVFAGLGMDWDRILQRPNPAGYAWGVLRYMVEQEHRQRGEVLQLVEKAVFMDAASSATRPVFEALEDGLGILQGISRLPARQYDALLLTRFMKYSTAQAGDVMGIKPSTVRVLVHQVRVKLDKKTLNSASPATAKERDR
ncbi:sigma-70 family RNA polymerase sigma factor [Kitasatospora griseola]|uniref:sigma-70 family RNA polymerase sigma factor n=1 Tax=Kitasatospora griseola TaxID=2064 RepID=UPI00381BF4FA